MAFLAPLVEVGAEAGAEAGAAGAEAGAAEGEEAAGEEGIEGGDHNLKNGHSLHLSQEQFQQLAHSDAVVAAVTDRAQKCCDIANELAVTKDAVYEVRVTNTGTRARAKVTPGNFKGVVDDAYHDTLLKAAAQTGSDPRIPDTESEEEKEEGPEREGEEGEAAEAGEAGEAGEVAEVAEIALL